MRDPGSATDLLRDSRVVRLLNSMGSIVMAAWQDSSVRRLAATEWDRTRDWSPAVRLRVGALVVMWAGVSYIAGLLVLPRYVTSGLSILWFAGVVVAAALVAFAAESVIAALSDSVALRAARRLTRVLFS